MSDKSPQKKYYIGLISGTSLDKIDAAIIALSDEGCEIVQTSNADIPDNIRTDAMALCTPGDNEIQRMCELDNSLGECFAIAALAVLKKSGLAKGKISAIGSHGQTIRHQPPIKAQGKISQGYTLQIANPNIIAERTGITTVADFRRRDMAANGHGAPLVPAFHQFVFSNSNENRVILNLGGIANITILPGNNGTVSGFDTGTANGLMDAWAQLQYQQTHDNNGEIAARGKINTALLEQMLKDNYFKMEPPKSTGREYFHKKWLLAHLENFKSLTSDDIMSTLSELSARTIIDAIKKYAPALQRIIACGGGVHNKTLLKNLERNAGGSITIEISSLYGIDPDYVEAMAFAWLAAQTLESKQGNIPTVTGAESALVLGGIYK